MADEKVQPKKTAKEIAIELLNTRDYDFVDKPLEKAQVQALIYVGDQLAELNKTMSSIQNHLSRR